MQSFSGKWLFPKNLVEQWVESRTINYPQPVKTAVEIPHLLLVAGSNDLLLDRTLALFRQRYPDHFAVFGNLGSLGGLQALRQGLCHIASSHLAEDNGEEYNFSYAADVLNNQPAVVNFCRREQGLLVARGNPKGITGVADIGSADLTIANRPLQASTRLLLDKELKKAGLDCSKIKGYNREFQSHLDVGCEVLSGRADVGPAIRSVATLLGLDFIPLKWERFDLLIPKDAFFNKVVQSFLSLLHEADFRALTTSLTGYDLSLSGKMLYPSEL